MMYKIKDRIGIEQSLMLDRKGMFRLISACLSSHAKQMMPNLYSKFTEIGLSIDFFMYDKLSCLFATCFPSDTLLRLWDLIFLELSSPMDGGVSKGLGYIISTCLYLLRVNEAQIMLANTPDQLAVALENSASTKFNTEEIMHDIYEMNTHNFVSGNWFSRRLSSISKSFGDAASYLDNARISFEEDLDLVFEKVMRENKAVWELLHPVDDREVLDYNDWVGEKSSILSKFKSYFSLTPSQDYSSVQKGQPKEGNLEFVTVYIFVYSLFDAQNKGKISFEMTCNYEATERGKFQIRKYDQHSTIDQCFRFRYAKCKNEVTFTVREDGEIFGSFVLDLNNFKADKVYKMWMDIVNEKNNENDLEFEIGVLCEGVQKQDKTDDFIFTHSLRRKTPQRIDILNEVNLNDFVKSMKGEVVNQIEFEKEIIGDYYSDEEVRLILNDKYNFVLTKDNLQMGRIDLQDLKHFNNRVLFGRWEHEMELIYNQFTTSTKQALSEKSSEASNILDKAAIMLICNTMSRRNHQLFGMPNQDIDYVFSLRNFLVSLVLLSSITLGQKLDLLYEIFDWEDGEGDGLDCKAVKLLCNTVLERNLQFVPSNQVNNMVDLLYQGEASCITSCVYTSYKPQERENAAFDYAIKWLKRSTKPEDREEYDSDEDENHVESVDLTKPFQDILWKYHDLFGNKSLCFHPKYSPFADLQNILKLCKYDIYLPKRKNVENLLTLVYESDGVKRVFLAYYNSNHKLIRVDEDPFQEKGSYDGIEKILYENKYFCNMENYPTSVSKGDFIFKAIHVPYFSDFMRSETVMRCEDVDTLFEEKPDTLDDILSVHILNKKREPLIICEFRNDYDDITMDPSLTHKLVDNNQIHDFVSKTKKGVVLVKLSSAYKRATLNDIAIRIVAAMKIIKAEITTGDAEIDNLDLDTYFWDFFRINDASQAIISHDLALEDITYNLGYEFVYHPIQLKSTIHRNPHPVKTMNDNEFDSYCLLEEIGATKQWASCRIVGKKSKDYIVELKNRVGFHIRKSRDYVLLSKVKMHEYESELFK